MIWIPATAAAVAVVLLVIARIFRRRQAMPIDSTALSTEVKRLRRFAMEGSLGKCQLLDEEGSRALATLIALNGNGSPVVVLLYTNTAGEVVIAFSAGGISKEQFGSLSTASSYEEEGVRAVVLGHCYDPTLVPETTRDIMDHGHSILQQSLNHLKQAVLEVERWEIAENYWPQP
jgi:hypothetical protein